MLFCWTLSQKAKRKNTYDPGKDILNKTDTNASSFCSDKIFFVQDKKYFVRAEGRGINRNSINFETHYNEGLTALNIYQQSLT